MNLSAFYEKLEGYEPDSDFYVWMLETLPELKKIKGLPLWTEQKFSVIYVSSEDALALALKKIKEENMALGVVISPSELPEVITKSLLKNNMAWRIVKKEDNFDFLIEETENMEQEKNEVISLQHVKESKKLDVPSFAFSLPDRKQRVAILTLITVILFFVLLINLIQDNDSNREPSSVTETGIESSNVSVPVIEESNIAGFLFAFNDFESWEPEENLCVIANDFSDYSIFPQVEGENVPFRIFRSNESEIVENICVTYHKFILDDDYAQVDIVISFNGETKILGAVPVVNTTVASDVEVRTSQQIFLY